MMKSRCCVAIMLIALSATGCVSIGKYQLKKPCTDEPLPSTPYRLTFKTSKVLFAPSAEKVISPYIVHGITDTEGYTNTVYLNKPEKEKVSVMQVVGKGDFGGDYYLKDQKTNAPLSCVPYKLSSPCSDPKEYIGTTDKDGHTVYFSAPEDCEVSIYTAP